MTPAADALAYSRMQKAYYNDRAISEEAAQGLVSPDYSVARDQAASSLSYVLLDYAVRHAGRPAGHDFDEIATQLSSVPQTLHLLDYGCGPGRLMDPLARHGFRIDGTDISEEMVSYARQKPALSRSRFYLSDGQDCGGAPSDTYDIVYSQLCFQHIASRTVRNRILESMASVLKEGGMVSVQLNYYPDHTAPKVPSPHVPWDADRFDAPGTNSDADVWVTPDQLHLMLDDFRRWFRDVRLQFVEFPPGLEIFNHAYGTWLDNVIVSGTTGYSSLLHAGQPATPTAGI